MLDLVLVALNGDNKIAIFDWDAKTGRLEKRSDIPLHGAPGPILFDHSKKFLYVGLRSTSEIASFHVDDAMERLTPLGITKLKSDPCYLSLDRSGRYLLSAYYRAGAVASHAIDADGRVVEKPRSWIRTRRYAHAIQTDPSNRFAFAPLVGRSNRILQFLFDPDSGQLTHNKPRKIVPKPKVGPRHFCFHPRHDWIYVSNEQGSSVTHYHLDAARGTLSPGQTLSTLPSGFTGENSCAQIHIHPSGAFLYVSNRGHDSIACFAIDPATGDLSAPSQHPTEAMPRAFGLDPDGNFLFAAGESAGTLGCFAIDQDSGLLTHQARYPVGEKPLWVLAIRH